MSRPRKNLLLKVALRKESVDRNNKIYLSFFHRTVVALRKESVDRNLLIYFIIYLLTGRSPQGERG